MISPQNMRAIQIDITNACEHECSNCTRFCGHHKKNFFMNFNTFKKAVNSLEQYSGTVGIIGGEPTLHPQFEKFCDYLKEFRTKIFFTHSLSPITNMQLHQKHQNFTSMLNKKIGLWSSLSSGYYKHFETINDTFDCQFLNDHLNTCRHQALLIQRKELGISDKIWIKKRNNCWIQNNWSASITPKGAFFCEIAASLDMLFNGPGGWQITNDWWKRQPNDFNDQLHWCEMCSACINVPIRLASDEIDDISPQMKKKLEYIQSPKIKNHKYNIFAPLKYNEKLYNSFKNRNDYMDSAGNKRIARTDFTLYPKHFDVYLIKNLKSVFPIEKNKDWIIIADNIKKATDIINKKLKKLILNPGVLYKYKNTYIFNKLSRSLRDVQPNKISSVYDLINLYPFYKVSDLTSNNKKSHLKKILINLIRKNGTN